MTNKKAIERIKAFRDYLCSGNLIWDVDECREAFDIAIAAMEVVRCNQCKHYEGVHGVQGNAPCAFWGIGAVMWDDFCKRGERND